MDLRAVTSFNGCKVSSQNASARFAGDFVGVLPEMFL